MSAPGAELPLVLVVDDKQNMLRLMAKVLREDARVRTASRGAEALRILEDEPVDVVLSDLRMPDMDGIKCSSAARRSGPRPSSS
jgi:CheY-like chemotaxis protein